MMNKSNDSNVFFFFFFFEKNRTAKIQNMHGTRIQLIAHSEWNISAYFSMFAELSASSYRKYENNLNRQRWKEKRNHFVDE